MKTLSFETSFMTHRTISNMSRYTQTSLTQSPEMYPILSRFSSSTMRSAYIYFVISSTRKIPENLVVLTNIATASKNRSVYFAALLCFPTLIFLYFIQHLQVRHKITAEPSDSKASLSATYYILDAVRIYSISLTF